ncbi:DNA-binding IclR family transcriptional regulator [Sphingomonas zeicaulis]|uniref:IclR family transcriptional regulator n=1 Tax=Sphingomonas zeicaulis TaxID=1632740 RepID=UPI003D214B35
MAGRRGGAAAGKTRDYSAPALEKAFDIFEQLALAPEGLTITEMSQRLGRSISEIFRIMIVMEQRRWLAKDPDSDRYSVTYKMLELAHRATPAQELTYVAAPIARALIQRTGQSCHLVVAADGYGLCVLREQAPGPTAFSLRLGTQVNLLTSCSGRILLSYATPDLRERMMDAIPGIKAKDRADIERRSAEIRERGYETAPSARTTAVTDISVPVFGFDGRAAAALTIPFLNYIDGTEHMTLDAARDALTAAGRQISHGLGWAERDVVEPVAAPVSAPKPRRRKAEA